MSRLTDMRQQRIDKLKTLREMGFDPFPAESHRTANAGDIISRFADFDGKSVTLAGRLMSIRNHGHLVFGDLVDETGKLQLYIKDDTIAATDKTAQTLGFSDLNLLDPGDIVEATGSVTKTQSGEVSLLVETIRLLTKTLRPLPDSWDGLKDPEIMFRRRYVDLVINPERRELFKRKAKFWQANRQFMNDHGFIEVETPVLEHVTGGADARPFTTYMNTLDQNFFLRISTELYQKRLIGGGFEKVFTIGPNFRNEGLSDQHLPEYYQIEWYWAYADYQDNMKLVAEMFRYIATSVYGKTKFTKNEHTFDLADEWTEISYPDVIQDQLGIDIFNDSDEKLQAKVKELGIKLSGLVNRQRLIDNLWKSIRKTLPGPAFLVNEPKFMSPLAKSKLDNPELTQRFHVIIAGSELGNGYSELNDPLDQMERFQAQQAAREEGDDEAQMLDVDFVEMLEYGMPPTSGYGMSERVFWFLENITAREGTLFPQLKHKVEESTREIYGIKDAVVKEIAATFVSNVPAIDPKVQERFPGIFFGQVVIQNVNIEKSNSALEELKLGITAARKTLSIEDVTQLKPIAAYRELFKATGVDFHKKRPSPEALLRRVVQGKGIYNINTAVDAYNLAVIETGVSLGGFDADKLSLPTVLRFSQKGEKMHLLGDETDTVLESGHLVYADQKRPITIDLNYRDINSTKITEKTKNIILFADGAPGLDETEVMATLKRGAELIQQFAGGDIQNYDLIKEGTISQEPQSNPPTGSSASSLPPRAQAEALLDQYVKNDALKHHMRMVAQAMEAYAKALGEDPELWYQAGLLHDLDWEMFPDEHPNKAVNEILTEYPEALKNAILAHGPERTGKEPETLIERYLYANDELSGFMHAVSLMRPGQFEGMQPKSVKKKLKDRSFASNVKREDIDKGVTLIGKSLDDHLTFLITVFQTMS